MSFTFVIISIPVREMLQSSVNVRNREGGNIESEKSISWVMRVETRTRRREFIGGNEPLIWQSVAALVYPIKRTRQGGDTSATAETR